MCLTHAALAVGNTRPSKIQPLASSRCCAHQTFLGIWLTINTSTDPSRRGEMTGLAMMVCSIGMGIGPGICTAVFAASITRDTSFPFNGHLAFIIMSACIAAVAVIGWNLIDDGTTVDSSSEAERSVEDEVDEATLSGCSGKNLSTGQANEMIPITPPNSGAQGRHRYCRRAPDALSTPRSMSLTPLPE